MKRFLRSKLVLILAAFIVIAAAIAIPLSGNIPRAHAQGTDIITEFPALTANSEPTGITTGPDGNLWFTEFGNFGQIGQIITTTGKITEFPIPEFFMSDPYFITAGPDGNLWFTESNTARIGYITTAGSITEFPGVFTGGVQLPASPYGITAGPDGNLWFADTGNNAIGQITTTGTITEFSIPTANRFPSGPLAITAGPDGNLWFTDTGNNAIGKIITTTGKITEFSIPTANSFLNAITAGPDGNLWFTDTGNNAIGKIITTTGKITEFSIPTANGFPSGITTGPDGNLWFTEGNGNKIGRISSTGKIIEFQLPTANSSPSGITAGPDGNLWFTERGGNKIGRVNLKPGSITTPPAHTTSRYMATVDQTTLMSEGQAQAQAGESGIVVLDFGQPLILNNVYGSCLFGIKKCFRSTDQIASAAEAFLNGYASAASSGQFLTLAIGTSNYGGKYGGKYVTNAHGQAWASMVNQVGQWIATQGFTNLEQVAGASDIELDWNPPATTRAWTDGYNSTFNASLQFGYFNYGDAAGCPTTATTTDGKCNGGWHQSDVVYVSWDVRAAYPLPEIYTVSGSQANEWYSLNLYSHNHPAPFGPMFIEGSFTQYADCQINPKDCGPSVDNTPQQGWQLLYNALNADPRTAQPLPFSTDITTLN